MSPASFQACADAVQLLSSAVTALQVRCADASVSLATGQEWYELLTRKLVPQLSDQSFLVVAVVGGTNIGKSVVFNHLAGFRASATSPLASGTRHPTCLIPVGFRASHDLQEIFPGFDLRDWNGPDEALVERGQHWLFLRESEEVPANLLILDTPDIDSDARVNWERADHVRQSADVLVAVLTQQKYNDAAVKEFFRKAAGEKKSVLVVLNQCLLPEDEPYWPLWVGTFCQETGIEPQIVYVAPNDRRAAESIQLPFFERRWPPAEITPSVDAAAIPPAEASSGEPRNLMHDLASLRFAEIKLRSLSGTMRQLTDVGTGLPRWLQEIREISSQYRRAAELLTANKLAEVADWPTIPSPFLVQEVRQWWSTQRQGWTARIHDSYSLLSRVVLAPVRMVRDRWQGELPPPTQAYRDREWAAILTTIERVYEKLEWLSQLGNELLQPRLTRLLAGVSRAGLIQAMRDAHAQVDIESELRSLVQSEMSSFSQENPDSFKLIRRLDSLSAAVRPAVSIVLALTGVGLVGDVVFTSAATTTLGHLTADVVGGTVAASVGETIIGEGVSQGASRLQLRLRQMHERFAASRATWLAELLQQHLLGSLPSDLARASGMSTSPEFQATTQALELVRRSIPSLGENQSAVAPAPN